MSALRQTRKSNVNKGMKVILLFACSLLISLTAAHATILNYPGPAPCNTTFQSCIDSSSPGDVIQIATDGPIDESLELKHSLTLKPAAGFTPVLSKTNDIWVSSTGASDNDFTIQGITMERGIIIASNNGTGKLKVSIVGNNIVKGYATNPTIEIRGNSLSDITFFISDNRITVPAAHQINGISIHGQGSATRTGSIKGNTIVMEGSDQGAAIYLSNANQSLNVDITGNVISGNNYSQGIEMFQYGSGSASINIRNNLITGQSGHAGSPGAISINGSAGSINFNLSNNTLSGNQEAIYIGGRKDLGAVITGKVENNIITNSTQAGLDILSDISATVSNRNNLLFNNDIDFFTAGPGTVFQDPKFIGGGNYRLQPISPAIDAGNNTPGGGLPPTDLDGLNRISGGTVDIGAYEHWDVMPLPVELQSFTYGSVPFPVMGELPVAARPIAVGLLAQGGDTLRVQVALGELSGPADIYFAIAYRGLVVLSGPSYPDLYLLGSDGTFTLAKDGLIAWKTNVTSVTASPFGDIPISALAPGFYDLYLLVTPAGNLNAGYLWKTDFYIPSNTVHLL